MPATDDAKRPVTKVRVRSLDPRATHVNNPDCPSRLIPMPNGHWMCIDCGFQILEKIVECSADE
jgi:hypothetical protein